MLHISSKILYSYKYKRDHMLCFIDVKIIWVVVAMVPHMPAIGCQEPLEQFFLVEKPRFDIAMITGIKNKLEAKPKGAVPGDNNTT
jgi:hypothetical protein